MSDNSGQWSLPDLYLYVKKININGEPHLDFNLNGNKLRRPSMDMGACPIGEEYQKILNDVLTQWEELCKEGGGSQASQLTLLRQKGGRLFELLLPEALQKELWRLRYKARDLIIDSTEDIPWELLHLQDPESEEEDNFLCMRYHIGRWLSESSRGTTTIMMPSLRFRMAPMALIQGDQNGISQAAYELKRIKQAHAVWEPQTIESSMAGISEAMTSAEFRSWHFVGHGLSGKNRYRDVSMLLESAEELTPDILTGPCRLAGKRRPFVFWNCCYSSRSSQFFGMRGWPETFMKHGFGAFLGTMWAVKDQSAAIFAETLYKALANGEELGDAILQARVDVKNSGSDDWLAYVLYGDPRAIVQDGVTKKTPPQELLKNVLEGDRFNTLHKPVLEILAAIQEPVPSFALARFAGISEGQLAPFIEIWKPHLDVFHDRIYPKDRLKDKWKLWHSQGHIDIQTGHRRIVTALVEEVHQQEIF